MAQTSVKKEVSWSGTGLHTGLQCRATVKPASAGFGIKFRRSDIEDAPWIAADVRKVSATNRSTSLTHGNTTVSTVEHLLAAMYTLGIDNAEIHVDGPEIPILDGSAAPFVHGIKKAGTEELGQARKEFILRETISYRAESGSEYLAVPSDDFCVEVALDYPSPAAGDSYASYSRGDDFEKEFAPARTYVFTNEIEELAKAGLIKGGTLENALVFKSDSAHGNGLRNTLKSLGHEDADQIIQKVEDGFELYSPNEPARHKVLDLLGDLSLLGTPIRARIIAKKPGHTANVAFASMLKELIVKDTKLRGKPQYVPDAEPIYDTVGIMGFLPHRYPFLLVDKIIELSDTHVVGVKNITFNEALFQGHFPNNPVFPGVLQMEALAQTGGILALNTVEHPSNWDTYFLKMDNVKFKRKVLPGDTLILKMELLSPIRRGIVHMQGTAYVGDTIVSEGELTAQIVDRTTLK
jgi:UDP-3-O-[3-hydroxymyristoyl] N-acetylglucosamine deacetylase/3-hydroxyacyl-[acyl-carrier-protein] dehydratase